MRTFVISPTKFDLSTIDGQVEFLFAELPPIYDPSGFMQLVRQQLQARKFDAEVDRVAMVGSALGQSYLLAAVTDEWGYCKLVLWDAQKQSYIERAMEAPTFTAEADSRH